MAVYLESGSGTEQTLRANREAFGRHVIKPRPMSGVNDPKTNTEFLGIPLSVPVLTAPFGGDALFSRDGHLAVARANAACGIASIVPEVGSFSYEEVAAAAPAAARIGQLHPFESFDPVAKRIKNAGYDALCVTVDCATMGWRVRNKMARFRFDPGVWFGNVTDDGEPNVASTFGGGVIPDWTWDQLAEATARHGLPWIAKGILTPSPPSRRSTRARPRSWSPTTAAARSTRPRPASTRSRRSRRPSAARSRCCSTAASAPAPTSSSRSPSARPRWSSAASPPTAWPRRASTGSGAPSSSSPPSSAR